jgi:hypothetical protein
MAHYVATPLITHILLITSRMPVRCYGLLNFFIVQHVVQVFQQPHVNITYLIIPGYMHYIQLRHHFNILHQFLSIMPIVFSLLFLNIRVKLCFFCKEPLPPICPRPENLGTNLSHPENLETNLFPSRKSGNKSIPVQKMWKPI